MKKIITIFFLAIFLIWPSILHTEMSGGNVQIYADSFSFVNTGEVSNGTITLTGTGDPMATSTSGGTVSLRGGFQALEKGILSFSVSPSSLSLGTLTSSAVALSTVTTTISTDSETGYSISISEDGNLRSGGNDINDVSDGTVTAGSEEYGIRTSGSDGLLTSDTAISGSVLSISSSAQVVSRETGVEFRASITPSTSDGTYSHIVTFTATVNP